MTRDDIIRMAREAGGRDVGVYWDMTVFMLERFAALVAAAEREACAKVCDERATADGWEGYYANQCAAAIRARGDKT